MYVSGTGLPRAASRGAAGDGSAACGRIEVGGTWCDWILSRDFHDLLTVLMTLIRVWRFVSSFGGFGCNS